MKEENGYRLEDLLLKYLREELTDDEKKALKTWREASERNNQIFEELTTDEILTAELKLFKSVNREAGLKKLHQKMHVPGKVFEMRKWKRYVAAAAVILVAFAGSYLFFTKNKTQPGSIEHRIVINDVAPGHDGAILTLTDGRTIVLDNAQDGKITDVAIKDGNKISYESSGLTKLEYNTMTTPKGRQFSLVLPDGSQVWLNAASSITYPTAFKSGDRKVSITGEAYFEVKKGVTASGAKQSFIVTVNGIDVKVLGTHFNINSYGDDGNIKTTLLEGSIQVAVGGKTLVVKPGQQVQVANNNLKLFSDADVDAVMAWKNGFFSFEAADIKDIMKQLSRWYDVEVIYQAEPKELFAGKIDRNLTLSQVLKALARNEVNFRIEDGKRIIFLP